MKYDVTIIGGGPGGYTCALACAGYGLKTALIERDQLGGTCLNRGCIPTKALLKSGGLLSQIRGAETFGISAGAATVDYPKLRECVGSVVTTLRGGIEKLLKAAKVDVYHATGRALSPHEVAVEGETHEVLETENIVLATGGKPSLPPIPGSDLPGVYTSDTLLQDIPEIPRLVIVGGGVIGVELAEAYHGFGSEVTIVEMMPRLLPPFDADPARRLAADFKKKGITVITKAGVQSISQTEEGLTVTYKLGDKVSAIPCDGVLIATGRKPLWKDVVHFPLEENRGLLVVDDNGETSVPHVYAIGDIAAGMPQLAHAAAARGEKAAAHIAGKSCGIDLTLTPQCVYTVPEIASVGVTEEVAKTQKLHVGRTMMGANGKSVIENEGGMVKLFADDEGRLLGGSLYCADADNLIGEVTLAVANHLTASDFLKAIRPHPSLEEALSAAASQLLQK